MHVLSGVDSWRQRVQDLGVTYFFRYGQLLDNLYTVKIFLDLQCAILVSPAKVVSGCVSSLLM